MRTPDTIDRTLLWVLFPLVLLISAGCGDTGDGGAPVGKPETIRIGAYKGEIASLIWVAASEGYFAKYGLDARVTGFDSSVPAVDAVAAGTLDMATAADFVFVSQTLKGDSRLRIMSGVATSESIHVMARTESGIASPADLKGKKIGVTRKTASEYYLHLYLLYQRVDPRSVTFVDLPGGARFVKAVVDGNVDAVITSQPTISKIQQEMGARILSWPAQSDQPYTFLLICSADFAEKRPEAARRLFRALNDAESLIARDLPRARRDLVRQLGVDEQYLASVWPLHRIGLSLDQSLLVAMEDQARWAVDQGFAPAGKPVNYLRSLYSEPLAAVRPDAVTLYR
jgi:NitT/TauT family transport system substrate-binding protein